MGRGLIVLLVVSLAANIFLVGAFSGRMLSKPPAPPEIARGGPPGFDHPARLMRHADQLSPESREKFRAAIRAGLPEIRAQHARINDLRRAYADALSAEPWDRDKIDAARRNLDAAANARRDLVNRTLIDGLETIAPEERAALIEAGRRDHWRPKGRRGPPDRGPNK